MDGTNSKLGGLPPTSNTLNYKEHKRVQTSHFIVADFIIVKPCELFFDENLTLKEDYDYTLQHIEKYGEVTRVEYILAEFAHKSNSGGAVAVRTPELEQKNIEFLISKWGHGRIMINKKRENEIVLKRFRNDPKEGFFLS